MDRAPSCAKKGALAKQLRTRGFKASEAKLLGFSAWQLEAGGYAPDVVAACDGRSLRQLCAAGVPLATLLASSAPTVGDLRKAGYTAVEMTASGKFSLSEQRRGGYTCEELVAAGANEQGLREAGFGKAEIVRGLSVAAAHLQKDG